MAGLGQTSSRATTSQLSSQVPPSIRTNNRLGTTTASAADTEDQLVDSVSRSQLPDYFNRNSKGEDGTALPDSAAGQGRQFYYGADEQSVSVKSKDFDDAYNVSGQSQILK